MAYCGPRGIAHSHFLGGPAVWTDLDRDKALAWAALERQTCTGCGTRADEWSPAAGGSRNAWEFHPGICPGCEQKERTEDAMRGSDWKDQRGKQVSRRRPPAATAGPS